MWNTQQNPNNYLIGVLYINAAEEEKANETEAETETETDPKGYY